jgi:hypothetical protein
MPPADTGPSVSGGQAEKRFYDADINRLLVLMNSMGGWGGIEKKGWQSPKK